MNTYSMIQPIFTFGTAIFTFGLVYRDRKQIKQKGIFQGNGNILYLNCSGGYTGVFINAQQQFKWMYFLYINYISTNLIIKKI